MTRDGYMEFSLSIYILIYVSIYVYIWRNREGPAGWMRSRKDLPAKFASSGWEIQLISPYHSGTGGASWRRKKAARERFEVSSLYAVACVKLKVHRLTITKPV